MNFLPPRIKHDSEKRCVACDAVLEPKAYEKPRDFRRRELCGRGCANKVRNTWVTTHEMLIHNTRVRATTGCWEWQGFKDVKGYGRTGKIDGEVMVHRVAYADANGPIPPGMHVLHKCDNPKCCNPDHLFLGTNNDNVRDRVAKGRSARMAGEENPNYRTGKYVKKGKPLRSIAAYWDSLENVCVCGRPSEHVHHIIHVNGQRITKDDWLVVKLCADCHQNGEQSVHRLGGERQFLQATGWDLVQLAVLRRHNFEVRG